MRKSKIAKISISLLVAAVVVVIGVYYGTTGGKGTLLNQAAMRGNDIPADGVVYIEEDMVGLAATLSGNGDTQAAAKAAFDLVNTKRQEAGLGSLAWNSGLEQASAVRAIEAAQSFSHTRPNGSDWWTVDSNLMYGENLAKGYSTAQSAVDAWMASPTHKDNLMDAEFKSGAIVINLDSNGQWYWAQEFGY